MKKHNLRQGTKKASVLVGEEKPEFYFTPDNWLAWMKINKPAVHAKLSKNSDQAELAKLLWAWRLIEGRTQQDLADRTGCSRATYQKLEEVNSNSNPTYLTLCKIAKSYGVSFKEFILGPGKQNLLT